MTRRGGRWTRFALRLGFLLGGVVAAWGVHEAATTAAVYAADRPPAAPVDAAVDLLIGVLRPILDTTTAPPGPEWPADENGPGSLPSETEPDPAPGRPPARPTTRPAHQITPPPARPVQVDTPKPAARGAGLPAAWPRGRQVLAPVGAVLRPVTEPVRARMLTAVSEVLRPVADPVRAGVVAPVADALSPVTQPLAPILSPVWRALEPVLEPLAPVLETIAPVTDLLDPPTGPPATPPPAPPPPAPPLPTPPTSGTVGGARPGIGSVDEPAGHVSGPAPTSSSSDWQTTRQRSSPPRLVRSDEPYPLPSDADSTPATPAPSTSGSGSSGTVHGNAADTPTSVWTPPSVAGQRCHPTGGDALASRSPRPGTRPA